MEVKGLLASAANHLGLLDAYAFSRRKLTKSHVAILVYHRISPDPDGWSTRPLGLQTFEKQIRYLSENYEVLPLDSLVQYLEQGKSLPQKAVVITLDDGYKDNYLYAYPVLEKYHLPATIFLTTGYIGTGELFWWDKINYVIHHTRLAELVPGELGRFSLQTAGERLQAASGIREILKGLPGEKRHFIIEKLLSECAVTIPADLGKELILSWEEINEMKKSDITFGAHTVTHPILTGISPEQAELEIKQSKKDIEKNIGQRVTSFAYPNGTYGDFDDRIIGLVRESGFTSAVTGIPGLINSGANPYELKRIIAGEDFNKFKVMLSGLYLDFKSVLS